MAGNDTKIASNRAANMRRRLLAWFDRERREMPWRETRDPYGIWLSEIMLQQTQVATVIPYYRRFTTRFPTVHHMADAELDDVLQLWAGLGYYARARNMHHAARMVVEKFGGEFPKTVEELRTLPGVGAYTAGAVASIAFNIREPIVDGNVTRVLARLFALKIDVKRSAGRKAIWHLAAALVPRDRPGDFNQALMELGATLCSPGRRPACDHCPLSRMCEANQSDTVARYPVSPARVIVRQETHVVAAIARGGAWLFTRRPRRGLWGGLWELPSGVLDGGSTSDLARRIAVDLLATDCRVRRKPFVTLKHQLTHRAVTFVGHVIQPVEAGRVEGADRCRGRRWLRTRKAGSIGLSTAMRKIVASLPVGRETD